MKEKKAVDVCDDKIEDAIEANKKDVSRRQVLKALGFGGALIACSSIIGGASLPLVSAADPDSKVSVTNLPNVKALKAVKAADLYDGMIVNVAGYRVPADGGNKTMVYLAKSTVAENGGTVHKPDDILASGAWHILHSGTGDLRWFGIFDESKPADNAMDCLVNDEGFSKIDVWTDTLFIKRHHYSRSYLELNFNNNFVYAKGVENAGNNNPFAAIFFLQGKKVGSPTVVTLPAGKDNYCLDTNVLYVGDNGKFAQNEWYFVETDVRPKEIIPEAGKEVGGGVSDKEIQKLLMVTMVGTSAADKAHIQTNYLCAWGLKSGRKITYQKIEPVRCFNISNARFEGQGQSDVSGAGFVAHEFCVECDMKNVKATKVFWPLNIRRYCTTYTVSDCELTSSEAVLQGGTGYMLQQIGCLYAQVSHCNAFRVRHLNDFVGCAFSEVSNCHCTGDENGAFVTHGQYDHDLTYIGNSGLLSFANSASNATSPHQWGGFHRRIVVKQHNASRVVFQNKNNRVADMTMEDVYCCGLNGSIASNAGSMWANADGLVMRNCTIKNMLSLGQDSSFSTRPNLIENCDIYAFKGNYFFRHRTSGFGITKDITFRGCNFFNIDENFFEVGNVVTFENCHFYGVDGAEKGRLVFEAKHLRIIGGGFHNVGIALTNGGTSTAAQVGNQKLTIDGGAVLEGKSPLGALIEINNPAKIELDFGNCTLSPASGTASVKFTTFGSLTMRAIGSKLENTSITIPTPALGQDYVLVQSCVLKNSTLTCAAQGNVSIDNNLTIS